jgi:arylsulfatase
VSATTPASSLALVLALAAGLAGCGGGATDIRTTAQHNVVVISIDSLRYDHVGAYGYPKPTTPALDALAAQSVVFERAYAPSSFTLQSVAAILTGRLPTSGGSVGLAEAEPAESAVTLGRMFRAVGARTGLISNQPLLRPRGFTRGFEDIQISGMETSWTATDVTARALQFIDDGTTERFFLYTHYLEPHQPYEPPAEMLAKLGAGTTDVRIDELIAELDAGKALARDDPRVAALVARYDAEIAAADAAIGELLEGLAERGLAENTVVIVTGSQGEELLEHDYLGHAWTLHEEVLRVPLILHAPGLLEPARNTDAVSTVDIYPSLVSLFGLDVGDWRPDGSSFLAMRNGAASIRSAQAPKLAELVIRERCIVRAVIEGNWKYVAEYLPCAVEDRDEIGAAYLDVVRAIGDGSREAPPLWGEIRREALYDLSADPAERNNVAPREPERLARLRGTLEAYRAYCEVNALKAREAVAPEITDPGAADRLRSLGYL